MRSTLYSSKTFHHHILRKYLGKPKTSLMAMHSITKSCVIQVTLINMQYTDTIHRHKRRQIESLAATNAAQLQAAKDAERVLLQRIQAAQDQATTATNAAAAAEERATAAYAAAEAAEAATATAQANAARAVDDLAAAEAAAAALREEVAALRLQLAAAGARLAGVEGELRNAMEATWQREEECRSLQVCG